MGCSRVARGTMVGNACKSKEGPCKTPFVAQATTRAEHPKRMSAVAYKTTIRAELSALNKDVLKKRGAPSASFGALPEVNVGSVILCRPELCMLGLHRHFLSEVSFTALGVESLLLAEDAPHCDDQGERIYYGECGVTPEQRPVLRAALTTNAERQRPVRILRRAGAAASALAFRSAGMAGVSGGNKRREGFRYDGVYAVRRLALTDAEDETSNSAASFLLLRLPDQPPLPPGIGGKARKPKRGRDDAPTAATDLCFVGELVGMHATPTLPTLAEAACVEEGLTVGDVRLLPPPPAPAPSRRRRCVCCRAVALNTHHPDLATLSITSCPSPSSLLAVQALRKLHAARATLLRQLTPQDAYVLAKRSLINQVRVRSALDLLDP